ncbi:MAG TPA: hypothetical protein VMT52_02355 [Planctomycetota bacterium]|nr:hypothetical protein [Planctomycetota bacterium]
MSSRGPLPLWSLLGSLLLASPAVDSQTPQSGPPPGTPPPPVTYEGLIPGVSSVDEIRARLGSPAHEAAWYAWKMLYPSKNRPGHFDSIHLNDKRLLGSIEAATVPDGLETWTAVRSRLGEPEYLLEFSRQSLADYSKEGVRFTFDEKGRTIGVAYVPHGFPRVHSGERSSLSLRWLRQGPQPYPILDSDVGEAADGGVEDELLCGAAEADISPVDPDTLGPVQFTLHDPLRARAAVFAREGVVIAIVGADVFGLRGIDVKPIETRLRPLGVSHLLLAMSHVHSAGDPIGIYGFYPEKLVKRLQDGVVEAVTAASRRLRRVKELRVASEELPLDGARVEGLFRNARNPGIVDPQVAVVQAVGDDGKPIVTLAHFACHPEGIASDRAKPLEVSADFPGYLCDALHRSTGAQAVFLNGAVGGMVSGDTRARTHEEAAAMGKRLAGEVERILGSAVPSTKDLDGHVHRLEIPVSNPRMVAFEMASGRTSSYRGRHVTEMLRIHLGGAEILTVPGELLPELSFEILERMRGFPRMIVGLANDQIGYIIPAHDFRAGAYEESMSLGPAAGLVVLRQALQMLDE